jgi:hypothetical protein
MGRIEQEGNDIVYRQDDGEVTAYLTGYEDKSELAHEGRQEVKIIFWALVAIGIIYLAVVLFLSL